MPALSNTLEAPQAPPVAATPAVPQEFVKAATTPAVDPSSQKALDQLIMQHMQAANPYYSRNAQWLGQGPQQYNTALQPQQEQAFRQWVAANKVPFNPQLIASDYDMRGFWRALTTGDPRANTAVNANDKQLHYPDYWKTPYHKSFSAESQWADPAKAPQWNDKDQLVLPDGTVVFDERAESK